MRYRLGLLLVLLGAVALVSSSSSAEAADGYGVNVWYGLGGNYGSFYNRGHVNDRRIPYFAAHPPVYYSYPVPRTYGYSPFAYPPYVLTPEVAAPQMIPNPHVPTPTPASLPESDRSTASPAPPEPLLVINPHVGAMAVAHVPRDR